MRHPSYQHLGPRSGVRSELYPGSMWSLGETLKEAEYGNDETGGSNGRRRRGLRARNDVEQRERGRSSGEINKVR